MSTKKIVKIVVEESNQDVTLHLTEEEMQRATRDSEYLRTLVVEAVPDIEPGISEDIAEQAQPESTAGYIWTAPCVHLLLALYEDHRDEFNGGNKRHKRIWETITSNMHKTDIAFSMTGNQCQSKLNGLKKTYQKILDHNGTSGNDRITWPFFDRMNELFGATGWAQPKAVASEAGPSTAPEVDTSEGEGSAKKKKQESILMKYMAEIKKTGEEKKRYRAERQLLKEEHFKLLLDIKERQHTEKMKILTSIADVLKKRCLRLILRGKRFQGR